MADVGRKSGFNEKVRETILRLIKDGKTEAQIAEVVGVCPRTLQNWKGKHIELMRAVRESKLAADELVEASLYSRALGYSHPETKAFMHEGCVIVEEITKHLPPDTTAAMFWLRNRQPSRWKEKTEGDVNVTNNVTTIPEDQLEARLKAHDERRDREKLAAKIPPAPMKEEG